MADTDLYELIQQADPETLQAMIDAGLVPDLAGVQHQRMGMGQALMDTPTPQGQHVGNTYVAASPLEHLAAAMRQGIGGRRMQNAMSQQEALAGQKGAGRLAYLRLLAGRQPPLPDNGIQTFEPPMPGTGGEF